VAITDSWGYAGDVTAPEWARSIPNVGMSQYGVAGYGDWRVTAGGGGDRAISIAAGLGWGHGVTDINVGTVVLNVPSVASGSRWDTVVARRVWGTGTTSFQLVTGTSARSIAGARTNTPGTDDGQPIALARVVAGSSTVAEIVDLRCIPGDGGIVAFDSAALQYLSRVGTVARIGNVRWERITATNGTPTWAKVDVTPDTGWVDVIRNSAWTWSWGQVRRVGPIISIRLVAAATYFGGWNPGDGLAALPSPQFLPDQTTFMISTHTQGEAAEFAIRTDGQIVAAKASNHLGNNDTAVNLERTYLAASV
jgi:hypothetical protein